MNEIMPNLKPIEPKHLCHYTSVDVLCNIFVDIKDEKMFFHASSVMFMNDSAEYMAARNCCRDGVDEIIMKDYLGIPFALCFSENEDIIPMWSMYAQKGKGICLMFDYNELSRHFENLRKNEKDVFNFVYFSLCQYKEFEYKNEDKKPLSLDIDYPDTGRLCKMMTENAFIKPPSFNYEKEWRLMVWQKWHPSKKHKIHFKVRDEELCPYLKIPIPVRCLKQIVLSPSASDLMIDSVRLLLANYAPGHTIKVVKSDITLKF